MPTVKPLDVDAVCRAAKQTGTILTLEEHSITGGLGSAIADALMESGLRVRFRKLGTPDRSLESPHRQPTVPEEIPDHDVAAAARELC